MLWWGSGGREISTAKSYVPDMQGDPLYLKSHEVGLHWTCANVLCGSGYSISFLVKNQIIGKEGFLFYYLISMKVMG